MKYCPNCNNQLQDDAVFCPFCGANAAGAPQNGYAPVPTYSQPAPTYDPYDHTAEFEAADISENKVICILIYLAGIVGVIVALLAAPSSKYTAFHIRQELKFTVVNALVAVATALLCWTVIVPIVAGIFLAVLEVIQIICFFQVCKCQAKEPAIIRGLNFLK